jgi:hypothetical protein
MSTFTGLHDTDMYLLSQIDDPFLLSQLYQTDEYIHNLLNSPSIIGRLTDIYSLSPSSSFAEFLNKYVEKMINDPFLLSRLYETDEYIHNFLNNQQFIDKLTYTYSLPQLSSFLEFLDKYVEKMVNNLEHKNLHNWMDERAISEDNALMLSLILYHIYNVQVLSKMTNRYDPHNDHSIFMNRHDFTQRIKILAKICINTKRYRCLDTIINFMIRFDLLDESNFQSILNEAADSDDYVALDIILPDDLNLFTPEKFYNIIKHSLWMSLVKGNLRMFDYLINHPASPKKHNNTEFIYIALELKDPEMILKTIETYDLNQQGELKEKTYNNLYDAMHAIPEDLKLYVENFLNQFKII